jgi:hypothetical protein
MIEHSMISSSIKRAQQELDKEADTSPYQGLTEEKLKSNASSSSGFSLQNGMMILSVVASIWYWFYPHPRVVLFGIVAAMPLVGLVINARLRPNLQDTIRSFSKDEGDHESRGNFLALIFFPALVLFFRFFFVTDSIQHHLESSSKMAYYVMSGCVLLAYLLLYAATFRQIIPRSINAFAKYILPILLLACYSLTVVFEINYLYDNSSPAVYKSKITEKKLRYGRRKNVYYSLKVQPNDEPNHWQWYSVGESLYNSTNEGQPVMLYEKKGLLNLPWSYVELESKE